MIYSIIQAVFIIKIQSNIRDQEKKRQRIYDSLNAETKPKFLRQPYSKQKKKILLKKSSPRKTGSGGVNKKLKEDFLTALATVIKKAPTTSMRKHANELKVHEKTEDSN